jgi:hypothetical protein
LNSSKFNRKIVETEAKEWSYGGRRAVVYFLLNYFEASHRDFDNVFIPFNLKATS